MEQLLEVFAGMEEQAEIKKNIINIKLIFKNFILFIKKVDYEYN